MTTVRVTAQADFIDRLISTPRVGLLELIWNALDADASRVVADLELGALGVLSHQVGDTRAAGVSPWLEWIRPVL